jgi:hypothetical protein
VSTPVVGDERASKNMRDSQLSLTAAWKELRRLLLNQAIAKVTDLQPGLDAIWKHEHSLTIARDSGMRLPTC